MEPSQTYQTPDIIWKYFADFTEKEKSQISKLYALYLDWNSRINVISRKDMDNIYLHHVLHSLAIAAAFQFKPGMQVLDLGCGGGFPGIPLAILFPETSFLMVDSINKKLTVVKEVAQELGLTNIAIRHSRVEDIRDKKFEAVVSRAVAPLKDLWTWSKPLLKKYQTEDEHVPNGLVCLKGGDLAQEIFESGSKPYVWDVDTFFPEPYFAEKHILYLPFRK